MPERLAEAFFPGKESNGLIDRELKNFVDVSAVDLHLEHAGLEAFAAALLAGDEDVGHEDHFDLEVAGALAGVTATAGDVEAERSRGVPALPGERCVGEDAADFVIGFDVRDRVRSRRLADRTLVDLDDVIDRLDAGDRVVRADALAEVLFRAVLAMKPRLERAKQHVVNERALARAGAA